MLQLLMHHVGRTDLTGIGNCHVRGLHSIMLHDQEGNRVRLYCAMDNIDTNSNYMLTDEYISNEYGYGTDDIENIEDRRADACYDMTLGLHGHSTDVRLEMLAGNMHNIVASVEQHGDGKMRRFRHSSRITGSGTTTVVLGERWRAFDIQQTKMLPGDNIYLEANKLHTLYVDGAAAWMVYERGPRINTDEHFFSYNPRAHLLAYEEDMYQTLSSAECQAILARVISMYQRGQDLIARRQAQDKTMQDRRDLLARCKEAVSTARAYTPSNYRRTGRTSDLRPMAAVTGYIRPSSMITLLTDAEWERWCNRVQRMPNDEGMKETEFLEWGSNLLATRGMIDLTANDAASARVSPAPVVGEGSAVSEAYQQLLNATRASNTAVRRPTSILTTAAQQAVVSASLRTPAELAQARCTYRDTGTSSFTEPP